MTAQASDPSTYGSSIEGADAQVGEALKAEGTRSPLRETKERIVGDAREAVEDAAAEGKNAAAAFLGDVSEVLSDAGSRLDERGRGRSAHYAVAAADTLRRFSEDVSGRDLSSLLNEVEQFARERPAVFLGAMFAAGFGAARFLRASGTGRDSGGYDLGEEQARRAEFRGY